MFQYSQAIRLDQTISEAWTTDLELDYWSMIDSLGNRSRIAVVVLNNAHNMKERRYFIMQRVRILDAYGATVFLGRVMSVEPHYTDQKLILTCRDYLGDLADKIVQASKGDGSYIAATRNGLISQLVEEEMEEPESGQDIDRSLLPRMLQDTGNYLESITKTYSLRGQYGLNPETRGPANYNYRGTKTVLEAVSEIASEDSQQDLQIFKYTNAPIDPTSARAINDPKLHSVAYWTDLTGGLSDGKEWFSTLRTLSATSTPRSLIANPSNTISAGLNASETDIAVTSGTNFAVGDVASIETSGSVDEDVLITSISTNTLTVTRGYNGTTAVVHTNGDVIRVKSPINSTDQDMMYFGSNSKFDGIDYTFRQSGSIIRESNYSELEWQYWSGNVWERFVPDYDTLFKVDEHSTEEIKGRALWRSLIENTSNCFTATGRNTFPATQTDGSHSSTTFTVDSTANLSVGGVVTIDSEQLKITAINNSINFTAVRAYNGTSSATHSNDTVVMGGHAQGMSDWKKRDLDQSNDMPSYNNWNANVNSGWRDWSASWQAGADGFSSYVMPDGTNRVTFLDDTYPKGKLQKHSLRNGDKLKFANFSGSFTFINGSHFVEVQDPYSVKLYGGYSPSATAADSFSSPSTNSTGSTLTEEAASSAIEATVVIVGSARPDDVNSSSLASMAEGGGRSTYKYWVRCWVKDAPNSTTDGAVSAPSSGAPASDYRVTVDDGYLFSKGNIVTVDKEDMLIVIMQTGYLTEILGDNETVIDTQPTDAFSVGEVITIDSEQMSISSIASNNWQLTVVRGVNRTVAADHALATAIVGNSPNTLRVTRGHNSTGFVSHADGAIVTGVIPAQLATVSIATKPHLFRDFRADDPKFFSEVWRYTRDISSHLASQLGPTAGHTQATVADGSVFQVGDVLTIESEDVCVRSISGNVLYSLLRGYNGTAIVTHLGGVQVSASLGNETNHAIPGGTWLSLNTAEGNSGLGSALMWSALGQTTPWLSNNTEQILLGSDDPFNGFELHAVQGRAYIIEAITSSSAPIITTTNLHGLTTGDYVLITGSDSGVDIDGYHQVTVVSTSTFTIPVNTQPGAAGTRGLIRTGVPDYSNCDIKFDILDSFPRQYWGMPPDGRLDYDTTGWRTIQATTDNYDDLSWSGRPSVGNDPSGNYSNYSPLGPLGPTRWRLDLGHPIADENHWYCEVRFNTDKPRNNVALKDISQNPDRILPPTYPFRQITNDEYDLAYPMTLNSAWNERASLLHPYAAYQYTGVHEHETTISGHHATNIAYSSAAYVSSTSTVTITFAYAHHCAVGDWIKITDSDVSSGTQAWDGVYKVEAITNRNTLVFEIGVTGLNIAGSGTVQLTRVSKPPNAKSLYWLRIRTAQKPSKPAIIRSVKTATTSRFKYFDRGKEPWRVNDTLLAQGSASNSDLGAVYSYQSALSTGRIELSSVASSNGYAKFTAASAHGLAVGDTIEILGGAIKDSYNGIWKVAIVIDADEFVIGKAYVAESITGAYLYKTRFRNQTVEASSPEAATVSTITHSSTGNPGTITTVTPHLLSPGDAIAITGASSSPSAGTYRVREIINGTQFTYEQENGTTVNITSAVTAGSITKHIGVASITAANPCKITTQSAHGLSAGHKITMVGTASTTPSINSTTLVKEVISATEFTIFLSTAGGSAGTANTGYISLGTATLISTVANTSPLNDVIYFGSKKPFNQLRFGHTELMRYWGAGTSLTGVWEYYKADNKGNSANWATLDVTDLTHHFKGFGSALTNADPENLHVEWAIPGFGMWKSCMAGQRDVTAANQGGGSEQTLHLDKRFGEALYFVRFRITSVVGTWSLLGQVNTVTSDQIWCGPNLWSPESEAGTLSGTASERHTDTLETFGLTLDDREKSLNDGSYAQVIGYELKDYALEFVNSVTVRGRSGSYAMVKDDRSIKYFRVVKEKIIDDPSLTNDTQCLQRAQAILEQLRPSLPLNILNITTASPAKVTTGGSTKYLAFTDGSNPTNINLFDTRGIAITGNSTEGDLSISVLSVAITSPSAETIAVADASGFAVDNLIYIDSEYMSISSVSGNTLGVVRAAFGSTAATHLVLAPIYAPNRTYVTTEKPHNLRSGDKVLITDVSRTAPRFVGIGAWSNTVGENTASYNFISTVWVTGQDEFTIQTASASTSSLAHHMSDLDTTSDPDTTDFKDVSNDAVGGMVHVRLGTGLQVGDDVRIIGSATAAANGTKTVSKVSDNGSTIQLTGVGVGTLSDIIGYALIAEPHELNTGDRVLLRNTSSIPSIDGYRTITRTSPSTFTVAIDTSTGRVGISGVIRPTSIREAFIRIQGFPVYTVGGMPRVLRAGDSVEVSLSTAGISNEQWLVYSIKNGSGESELTLFRDIESVAEPGDAEKKLLRDLSTHIRETANAVFQPIDKSVETGLDFLPEGPNKLTTKLEYAATDKSNNIDVPAPGNTAGQHNQTFPDDFRLSFRMYENYATREFLPKDLIRIDGQGLRSDDTGEAIGGAGLNLIARDKNENVVGGTPDFHPNDGEATLYLRKSATFGEGDGLYLAHRGIFSLADTFDEWDTDTPAAQAEVFVGWSGRVQVNATGHSREGEVNIRVPYLSNYPRVMATTESNGYVQVTMALTGTPPVVGVVTLTVRDAAGATIGGAIVTYLMVFNSTSNTRGLDNHI